MKSLVLMLFMVTSVFSKDPFVDTSDDINNAIKQGDAKAVAAFFNDKVDLKIKDQEDVYSKAQAESVVKDFFLKNKVKGFTPAHSSASKGANQFVVGTLDTSTGKYRVSYLLKKNNEKFLINQFRIEDETD